MKTSTKPLSPAGSLLLDVVRLSAAITVACGHLTQRYFSTGWADHTRIAQGAVTVFFILSGFVIRHITLLKPSTLTRYGIDRASRIYSVALPAVLFTVVADSISRAVNPLFYKAAFEPFYNHFAARIVTNLLFISEIWHKDVYLFSNTPFWSLSFECFYYALYGIAFYRTGTRRVVLFALLSLVGGPAIVVFFSLWLLGCLLHAVYQRARLLRWPILPLGAIILSTAIPFTLRPHLWDRLYSFNYDTMEYHHSVGRALGSQWIIAVPVFTLLLFGLLLVERIPVNLKSGLSKLIRYAAEATFPLYLFHFPLFVLIAAFTNYNRGNSSMKFAMLFFALGVAVLMGSVLNHLKLKMRAWMTAALQEVPPGGPSSAS